MLSKSFKYIVEYVLCGETECSNWVIKVSIVHGWRYISTIIVLRKAFIGAINRKYLSFELLIRCYLTVGIFWKVQIIRLVHCLRICHYILYLRIKFSWVWNDERYFNFLCVVLVGWLDQPWKYNLHLIIHSTIWSL